MSEIVINTKYEPLFTSETRYNYITGGRASGKSYGVTTYLVNKTYEEGHKILFLRYTMTSAHLSIIPQFISVIEDLGVEDNFDINKTEITNKTTGVTILFRGVKTSSGTQTANLKSITDITMVVFDEFEEIPDKKTFKKIDYSVRVKGVDNKIIMIQNPSTKQFWGYEEYFLKKRKDTTYIHTSYLDNIENLNEDIIKDFERLKTDNPKEFNNIVMGGWLEKADGVIYESWERGTFDTSLDFVYGSDFGYTNDPSTIMKIAIDEKRKLIYLEECYYGNCNTDTLVNIYKEIVKDDIVISDVDLTFVNIARGEDLNIYPTTKNIKGWDRAGCIKTIQGYNIIICGESLNTVKELNNYSWITSIKHGYETSIPMDGSDHCLDPLRYGFQFLKTGR